MLAGLPYLTLQHVQKLMDLCSVTKYAVKDEAGHLRVAEKREADARVTSPVNVLWLREVVKRQWKSEMTDAKGGCSFEVDMEGTHPLPTF